MLSFVNKKNNSNLLFYHCFINSIEISISKISQYKSINTPPQTIEFLLCFSERSKSFIFFGKKKGYYHGLGRVIFITLKEVFAKNERVYSCLRRKIIDGDHRLFFDEFVSS